MFKGAGDSVVSLTQDTIAGGVGTAASVGSGHFYVTADVVCGAGWWLWFPAQWFWIRLLWLSNVFPLISFLG